MYSTAQYSYGYNDVFTNGVLSSLHTSGGNVTQNVCCYLKLVEGILHRELVAVEPFSELKQVLHLLPTMRGGLWGWRGRKGGGVGKAACYTRSIVRPWGFFPY